MGAEEERKASAGLPEDASRDYDVRKGNGMDDSRFAAAHREALFFQLTCFLTIGGTLFIAWQTCPVDTGQVKMVFGVPVWYGLGMLILAAAFVGWTCFCRQFGGEMPLDAREGREAEEMPESAS